MFNKKILPITLILLLIVIILVALLLLSPQKKGSILNLFPIPTPVRYDGTAGSDAMPGMEGPTTQAALEQKRRSNLVYQLIPDQPFIGKNFSLYYYNQRDQFVLYINPSDKQAGNDEFDAFLKSKGVDERSWIENLFITYILPSPSLTQQENTVVTPAP